MFISIKMAFVLQNVNLEAVACIGVILCSLHLFLFILLALCDEEKALLYVIYFA